MLNIICIHWIVSLNACLFIYQNFPFYVLSPIFSWFEVWYFSLEYMKNQDLGFLLFKGVKCQTLNQEKIRFNPILQHLLFCKRYDRIQYYTTIKNNFEKWLQFGAFWYTILKIYPILTLFRSWWSWPSWFQGFPRWHAEWALLWYPRGGGLLGYIWNYW